MRRAAIAVIGSAGVAVMAAGSGASATTEPTPPAEEATPGAEYAITPDDFLSVESTDESDVFGGCGFEVRREVTGERIEIELGETAVLLEPSTEATLTNVENGASVTVDISGPSVTTETATEDGGFVGVRNGFGSWLHGQPTGLVLTQGQFVEKIVVDGDGNLVFHETDFSRADVVDMCEELSSGA